MARISLRIWILIIALILALLAISPSFEKGVVIKSIDKNSTAYEAGLRTGMIIKEISSNSIEKVEDYSRIISEEFGDNKTEVKLDVKTDNNDFIFLTEEIPDIVVADAPKTNIRTGLDLSGGARALVKPVNVTLTDSQMSDLISVTNQRINVFGISDVDVRSTRDLEGNTFMLVEIAGATPSDIEELVAKEGKFEAKVGNKTVFEGGERDIRSVCRNDASCSGITSCFAVQEGYACNFQFVIYLSEEAAQRHADVTRNISLGTDSQYLAEKLY